MTRIYFDTCCLNRPFDDQTQSRIRFESESVAHLIRAVEKEVLEWTSSEVLLLELKKCPDELRRLNGLTLCRLATRTVQIDAILEEQAIAFRTKGLREWDAYHLACAVRGQTDVLVTVDDRFVSAAARIDELPLRVMNPVVFEMEMLGYADC